MKVIVLSGIHGNETAGLWICDDLKEKKKGKLYSELSELAARPLNDDEVTFLDVSGHTAHALQKEFMKKYPLKKLLKLYKKHVHKISREYRKLLRAYIELWSNTDIRDRGEAARLKEKCFELARNFHKKYYRHAEKTDFIFPEELRKYLYFPRLSWKPETYEKIQFLKGKLGPGTFIIDLHCIDSDEPPYLCEDFYFSRQTPPEKRRKLMERLGKCCKSKPSDGAPKSAHEFGGILVEIPHRYIETPITESYLRFSRPTLVWEQVFFGSPNVAFLELLNFIFTSAIHGQFLPSEVLFFNMKDEILGRELFTDPAFCKLQEFHRAKKFVANIIKEVVEWGEQYEDKTS